MMEAQHQRLAAALSAAPAPPLAPLPVLSFDLQQQQEEEQDSKDPAAAGKEPAERHYQGSQEVRREEMMRPMIGQTTTPRESPERPSKAPI